MHRCRRKAVLNLNSSAAPNGTICYFLNWLIPFIAFAIFFSGSSSRTKLFVGLLPRLRWTPLHATIWQERLIILMVCNVSQVQQMTRSPFSEKQSYQMMTERGERGGGGPKLGVIVRASYCYKLAIIYPIGHVWFGVRVNGGGKERGKSGRTPAWGECWKAKHPLISCASLHFR